MTPEQRAEVAAKVAASLKASSTSVLLEARLTAVFAGKLAAVAMIDAELATRPAREVARG